MFPYVKPHGIAGLQFQYFNQESRDWYDPLKVYTLIEYEWVRANCKLEGETVVDAGCHHGNYAVVFKPAFVIAIDNVMSNCNYAKSNMTLNGMMYSVQHQTLGAEGVKTNKRPSVYKVDIEGSEFQLFPHELARHPSVKVWIVEIHPAHGDPDDLARMFAGAGFELLKVCRDSLTVRPYKIGEKWKTHATLIARKV
jgi:hypothetical protein